MRFLHTSDWHLGQTLHGQDRHYEHAGFLDWLLEQLDQRRPDALLVAGDVFDTVNPPVRAQELLYDFIVRAHERDPHLQIVMIAGNHDSGARIELPGPLMRSLRAHALGRIRWLTDGSLDVDRLLIPLEDRSGRVDAWCMALPFLRPAEVTASTGLSDYVEGVTGIHEALIAAALERRDKGQALVAMSHAHLSGASVSGDSERPIVMGGLEDVPAKVFPREVAYAALGHLHRPQRIGRRNGIRYSGSPLPLSFAEVDYNHQIVDVTLDGEKLAHWEAVPIPRRVDMLRIPSRGPAPLEKVLEEIDRLTLPGPADETSPWLEVRVLLDTAHPDLRHRVEQALDGKGVRLVRLSVSYPDGDGDDAASEPLVGLDQLDPRDLFTRVWRTRYESSPPDQVLTDFNSLLVEVTTGPEDDDS